MRKRIIFNDKLNRTCDMVLNIIEVRKNIIITRELDNDEVIKILRSRIKEVSSAVRGKPVLK